MPIGVANYLSVGQIYFIRQSSVEAAVEAGAYQAAPAWALGTTPGLNFIYAHLNRIIKARDLRCFIAGPGHGGPGLVANVYLEGTYSEVYRIFRRMRQGFSVCSNSFRFRRHPEPCRTGNAWFHSRGRRVGLFVGSCLWRGVRSSGVAGGLRDR